MKIKISYVEMKTKISTLNVLFDQTGWPKGMLATCNTLNIYIDGSKMDDEVSARIYCPELGISQPFKLPDHCSIFRAEVYAIAKAAEQASNARAGNFTVNIYVDSQEAIKAVISYRISASVLESREAVKSVARNKQFNFYWVPGHKGIESNEIVDEISKNGVNYRSMMGIQIGYCLVTTHARKMGLTDQEDCRERLELGTGETMEHILCTCPALARLRCYCHLRSTQYYTLEEVLTESVKIRVQRRHHK